MSSAEELTFVVGRLLRSVAAVLDVVRHLRLMPLFSREHGTTKPGGRFGRGSFRACSED
jgi:hypothetical protein